MIQSEGGIIQKFMRSTTALLWLVVLCVGVRPQCLPSYEYAEGAGCLPCAAACLNCFDAATCLQCMPQYYLAEDNACRQCLFGCAVCSDGTSCLTCNEGLYLTNQGTCQACSTGVATCTLATVQTCQKGYFLLASICAGCLSHCDSCSDFLTCNDCASTYYLAPDASSCLPCTSHCLTCTDSSTCIECQQGYSISAGTCQLNTCSSIDPFCISCSVGNCTACEQGKYLEQGTCKQGGSLLCLEAKGPYHTNCETSNYGCPTYTDLQVDQLGTQLPVCLPRSATQLAEYIYLTPSHPSCSACTTPTTLAMSYNTRQAYYQLNYHLRLRLLGSLSTRTLNFALTNSTSSLITRSHTLSLTRELAAFTQVDNQCLNCHYAEVVVSGSLSWAGGEYATNLSLSDEGGVFWVIEAVIQHMICQVARCSNCSSAVDCYSCFSPYLLQLTTCVSACDAGFYLYNRICYLQCPLGTYTLSFNYTCTPCIAPCMTCANATHCLTCQSNYFLEGTSCLTTCSSLELFANSTSGKCQNCPNPCVTCKAAGNGSVVCLSCAEGYLLEKGSCSYVCPWGQFGNFLNAITQCSNCSSACSSCSLNSTVCGACNSGYLLLDSSCLALSACPVGYYSNVTINGCQPCHYPCAACSSSPTHCLSCVRGSLFQNVCLNECPVSYYSDYSSSSNTTCQPCQSPCSSCTSLSSCRTCLPGYYLHGVSCLSACPTYFYAESSNSSCVVCIPPCKSCLNSTACLSCTTGYLDNTTCTLACNSSAYVSSSFICTVCPAPCLSCYSSTNCLRCQLPYLLYGSTCISLQQCLNTAGFFPDYSPNASQPQWGGCNTCTFPCATCSNTSVGCLSCANTYLFVSDMHSCVSVCPTSYYQINSSCLACAVSCYQCSLTSTNCTVCSSGMYLLMSTGTCQSSCPDTYYGDDATQTCVSCSAPCKTCYSTYLCSSCLTGILYSKQCVSTCPSSTFLNTTINSCFTCTSNCLTCSSSSACLSCISGYYLSNTSCLSACPSTTFGNDYTRTCDSCSAPCSNCSSASRCLDCVSSYYFYNGVCTTTCSAGKYADNSTFTCKLCNSSICLTCQNDPNSCLTCVTNYFLEAGICKASCSSNKYANSATATCDDCPFPCSACTNYSYCTSCLPNYLLYSAHCFSRCPQGYYPSNNSCLACSSTCMICSSSTVCLQCSPGYLVMNGACVTSCQVGWFAGVVPITNYDSCIQCQSDCVNCSSYDYCLQCVSPGIAFNGLCLESCPIFYYAVNASACDPCSPYCSNCTNSSLCLNCAASYLYLGVCTASCPAQTFADSGTCQPCLAPCFNCTSNFTCLSCQSKLIYFHSYCVSACPSDVWFYPHNNSCGITCPYNKYASNMTCFIGKCGHSMVSLNGYCLQQCSIGYYVDLQHQCVLCNGASICSNLFKADLEIVYSDRLTLSLYFNQKAELASAGDVNITFVDIEGKLIPRNYSSYEITPFKIQFQFDHQSVELVNISMQIPYVASQESSQCISSSLYKAELPVYNDYSTYQSAIVSILPLIVIALLFVLIVINVCNKASRFTQMLDFTQLIAVTLYLDVQYPPILEDFLSGFRISLLSITKNMVDIVPYSFSPPKFIFYHTDTSLFRNQLLLLLVFLIVFIVFIAIIAIHTYNPAKFVSAVKLIRYRLLNDLFSLCITPLFLFGCQLQHATPADIFIAILLGILGIGYVGWISYKIVEVKKMEELAGLLGDFERTQSKLGLMYTPFAFVRRIILTFGLGISPFSPISTLTLLLVFTILIMICIYFYQPFDNQYTDYVTIFMQSSLTLYVLCLIILALEVLTPASSHNLGIFCVSLVSITAIISLAWLIYLTVAEIRTKGCCPKSKEETTDLSKVKDDYSEGDHKKEGQKDSKKEKEIKGNKKEEVEDNSAHQFLHRISGKSDEIFSKSHENEEFKHWSEQSSNKQEPFSKKQMGLPQLLIKKEVNVNNTPTL